MSDPVHPGYSIQLGEVQAAYPPAPTWPSSASTDLDVRRVRLLHVGQALASLAQQASDWGLGLGECALAAIPALRAQP